MKKMTAIIFMVLVAVLTLWTQGAMATSGHRTLVNDFCGSGMVSCSSCHTNDPSYNCDTNTLSNCTAEQINFLNDRTTGKYCSFCPDDIQCVPAPTGCNSDAECDDNNVCNGDETCNISTGQCVAGASLTCDDGNACNGSESCDMTNGCQAGTSLACDDGQFCNGSETCDTIAGCQTGSDPCSGQNCDEGTDSCVIIECQSDAECDDGNVCNGDETCNISTGQCVAGTSVSCDDGLYCNGIETCDETAGCLEGTAPCLEQDCDETVDSCESEAGDEPARLYAAHCADCHGEDGSGGMSQEDVRGESGSEIREAIAEEEEMRFLSDLTFDQVEQIAIFLSGGNHNDDHPDDEDHHQDSDSDGDGMSDEDEGYTDTSEDDEDSDEDEIPDYMNPKRVNFPSDDDSGHMVLITLDGELRSCSTVEESKSLTGEGKPEDVVFPWGFIDFTVTGVTPHSDVEVTLVMPENLPGHAQYWKYDGNGYHSMDDAVIDGREVRFTLTDEDGDGIVVDPGAVGVSADVTSSGSSGGSGCSVRPFSPLGDVMDPGIILLIMIPFLIRLRSIWRKA